MTIFSMAVKLISLISYLIELKWTASSRVQMSLSMAMDDLRIDPTCLYRNFHFFFLFEFISIYRVVYYSSTDTRAHAHTQHISLKITA